MVTLASWGAGKSVSDRKVNLLIFVFVFVLIFNFILPFTQAFGEETEGGGWLSGWLYRKGILITAASNAGTNYQVKIPAGKTYSSFFPNTGQRETIIPGAHHGFDVVHNTNAVQCNKTIDGQPRTYLAYDSNDAGNSINLYYSNSISGNWTAYTKNPILSGATTYRTPSVAYVNGVFEMFEEDILSKQIKRYNSTDGITFTYAETVLTAASAWTNPFIWLNPNDNKWYLFYGNQPSANLYNIYARSATDLRELDTVPSILVISTELRIAYPTINYWDGRYWLLVESGQSGDWDITAWHSSSITSGYQLAPNSLIAGDDEACPKLVSTDSGKVYLFTNRRTVFWYQDRREVLLGNYSMSAILDNHCLDDFGDVRFTNNDGSTELSYWMESSRSGDSAIFWVRIPDDLSSASRKIYIYYGKADATTISNGVSTFLLFDDFNDAAFNTTLWKLSGSGATVTEANGALSLAAPSDQKAMVNSAINFSMNTRIRGRVSRNFSNKDSIVEFGFSDYGAEGALKQCMVASNSYAYPFFYLTTKNSTTTNVNANCFKNSANHIFDVCRVSPLLADSYIDDVIHVRGNTSIPTCDLAVGIGSSNSGVHVADWIFVSKYVSPEPAQSVLDVEEQAPVIVTQSPPNSSNNIRIDEPRNNQNTPRTQNRTVLSTSLPGILIISPENRAYEPGNIALTFVVNKTASWMAFSVDSPTKIPITGNASLPSLTEGMHKLTIYVKDSQGNSAIAETLFSVISNKVPEPLPLTSIIIVVASLVLIAGVGLPVCLIKFKRLRQSKTKQHSPIAQLFKKNLVPA